MSTKPAVKEARASNVVGCEVQRMTAASEVLQRGNRLAEQALAIADNVERALECVTRPSGPKCKDEDVVSPGYPALLAEFDNILDRVEYALRRIEDTTARLEV